MPGPDSVGIFTISQSCSGVAARACGLVSLEPTKILEILKDRPSWQRDCRNLEVFTMFPAGNGGTIELVYTQFIFVNFRLSHSVPFEKMIVLDLFADVKPYGNHHLNSMA
ncbi:putative START domain-containing protein [Helianthus anomalus]